MRSPLAAPLLSVIAAMTAPALSAQNEVAGSQRSGAMRTRTHSVGLTRLAGFRSSRPMVQQRVDSLPIENLKLEVFFDGTQLGQNMLAALSQESAQGQDFNGDGDLRDLGLLVLDGDHRQMRSLGYAVPFPGSTKPGDALFQVGPNTISFLVDEADQNRTDLNNDGDINDQVLHSYDRLTRQVTNSGLAVRANSRPEFRSDGELAGFRVFERDQGNQDLNGDGDTDDRVLHVWDLSEQTITNLALVSTVFAGNTDSMQVGVGLLSFLASESGNQADYNNDGDMTDDVVQLYDSSDGRIHNTALAGYDLRVHRGTIGFRVWEFSQGNQDLNGDGDALDEVVHLCDSEKQQAVNVMLAVDTILGRGNFVLGRRLLAIMADEMQNSADYNGDGDQQDNVLHVYDGLDGRVTNIGLAGKFDSDAGGLQVEVAGDTVAFSVRELAQGQTDLNGDGDLVDKVLHVFHASSGRTDNLRVAVPGSSHHPIEFTRRFVAFLVDESEDGNRDLNQDGDMSDMVMHVLALASDQPVNLGFAVRDRLARNNYGMRVSDQVIAFLVDETDHGQQDLNNDGDSEDAVLHVLGVDRDSILNVRLAVHSSLAESSFFVQGNRWAFNVDENDQGQQDLNGNGSNDDFLILHVGH